MASRNRPRRNRDDLWTDRTDRLCKAHLRLKSTTTTPGSEAPPCGGAGAPGALERPAEDGAGLAAPPRRGARRSVAREPSAGARTGELEAEFPRARRPGAHEPERPRRAQANARARAGRPPHRKRGLRLV